VYQRFGGISTRGLRARAVSKLGRREKRGRGAGQMGLRPVEASIGQYWRAKKASKSAGTYYVAVKYISTKGWHTSSP
jgi:hypothetical protein